MKRVLKSLTYASLLSGLLLSSGNVKADDVTLGYIPASLEYPYNVASARGFEEEGKKLGANVVVVDPRGSVEKQANAVEDMLSQGVQGIAVLPLDGIVAQAWVDNVTDRGIPFVSLATQIGDPTKVDWADVYPKLTALVGMDNIAAGERAGELAATFLPGDRTAKVAIVEGAAGYPQVWQRSQGFKTGLDKAGVKYEIVASQPTEWTPETGEAVCQNVLSAHPDIDLIFSQADDMALGCARAIDAVGSEVKLVATGGGSKLGMAAIEAGELDGSVCDKPAEMGRLAARALYEAVTKKNTQKAQLISFDTPAITKETLQSCPETW